MLSECCSVTEVKENNLEHCPRCGSKGRTVSLATVGSMAKTDVEALKLSAREYKLCHNWDCPVVYYAAEISIERNELRVPVNFKEKSYEGPVCYCFNHTIASIRGEIESRGHSTASEKIAREVKAGRCACEVKNPAGTCCLGDVLRAVQQVSAASGEKTLR